MFRDREYFSLLVRIALPIAVQNLISSSLNAVGVLLVGQLGDVAVAAVGLGGSPACYCSSVRTFVRTKCVTLALASKAQHGANTHQLPVMIAPARS